MSTVQLHRVLSDGFQRSCVRIGTFEPFDGGRKAKLAGGLCIDVHAALELWGEEFDRHVVSMDHVNTLKPETHPRILQADQLKDGRVSRKCHPSPLGLSPPLGRGLR